jgi:hypothetical protein
VGERKRRGRGFDSLPYPHRRSTEATRIWLSIGCGGSVWAAALCSWQRRSALGGGLPARQGGLLLQGLGIWGPRRDGGTAPWWPATGGAAAAIAAGGGQWRQ